MSKPGAVEISTYSVQSQFKHAIAKTGVADNLESTVAVKKIPAKFKFTNSEKSASFVLITENNTDKAKYFFVAPHTYLPEEFSLSTVFECLCRNHVYKVPPHKIWFRVVRLDVDVSAIKSKQRVFRLVHNVVEVSESDAISKYREIIYEQL